MKYLKIKYWIAAFILVGGLLTACSEDIAVGTLDENRYSTGDGSVMGYISDNNGKRMFSNVEFRDAGDMHLQLKTTAKLVSGATVAVSYDETVLTEYNNTHGTAYEAFPQQKITLADGGIINLSTGSTQSVGMKVSYTSDGNLSADKSYVIPLRMKVTSGDFKLAETDQTRLIFVKDLTGIPDCTKYIDGTPGVKVFSCMEVNDTNPLNNLSFTLASNGKPLVDALIIFSANINYNEETGRVYIFNNENVKAILDNREKYLKPLQERGIKIILGLLGNHDRSGVANMSKETAQEFAKEVKAMCDAYQLDGIFVDDEYSTYEYSNFTPGFVYPGKEPAARLCYEVKKIQPERWVVAYAYSTTYGLPAIDGMNSGEFVDYALHDYGGSADLSSYFPGMPKSNMGLYSQEFSQGRTASESNLKRMRDNGFLSHMIFAMDPNRTNFTSSQLPAMQRMARAFYDDELVFDGIKYPKDWK
ncbi:hypothetical protein M2451_002319 [Dysgonomonas sp. PFB1-18]|uniref:BT_3987 domain-containing protein n=1 Tax=unclassified Dysgonomonas TaxID=2630389 RepID=UPI002474445D|nr:MULTISPECIES: DUF1735 domain-containing protein [unclassified Dysgonomonas]MDH6307085.1 hypothetical protein [Dysgonomonas sp. PF1-14]MDH6337004.1 hypothetical protein [Dysgonomonas sp. PF1-16]MDH6380990.1 hypothetical protein [Dysgonomonas sp. PFB1-18]MDH6396431.1 hypothetical protein [Dysgonomonas sp. PF1-23]